MDQSNSFVIFPAKKQIKPSSWTTYKCHWRRNINKKHVIPNSYIIPKRKEMLPNITNYLQTSILLKDKTLEIAIFRLWIFQ